MKKILMLLVVAFIAIALTGCSSKPRLYLLNWGEYINEELVVQFEKENNVKVMPATVDSNEGFYQRIVEGTTAYDIAFPSDYMIEKLWDEGYLQAIDLTKLTNFDQEAFVPGLDGIMNLMFLDNPEVTNAYSVSIPYFWGVFGIMYNRTLAGVEEYIEEYQWRSVFEPEPTDLFSRPLKVGMYSVPRFAYSTALIYANDVNRIDDQEALNTYSTQYLELAETILSQREYHSWHTDMLKKDVDAGILDLAFVYVGDFFDTFLIRTADATTPEEAADLAADIGIFVPSTTMAFYDGMVIPTNARNSELAHKFIDFFLNPTIAYKNSGIVGYTTCLQATATMIETASEGDEIRAYMASNYPYNPSTILNFSAIPLVAFSDLETDAIAAMVLGVQGS